MGLLTGSSCWKSSEPQPPARRKRCAITLFRLALIVAIEYRTFHVRERAMMHRNLQQVTYNSHSQ